ncbi:hypothetical protein A3Q56_08520, partial [Intoshia linei]
MALAKFDYTYEYQGNTDRLVQTKLTDKCFIAVTQAMHMGLGGSPYGPAGTGKTESIKTLGSLLGRHVLVFNCDEGIDIVSIGRIFIGLVMSGGWGCFDEFNRLDEHVLSAISIQIEEIQKAIFTKQLKMNLLNKEIDLNPNSAIFITMNPAGNGYGARQKLPDNLKQLFRSVSMSKPDIDVIGQVILYSDGFKFAERITKKLETLFNLSRTLLSKQQHYDWGLRCLSSVIVSSGKMLIQFEKSEITIEDEIGIIVCILKLTISPKLTHTDCIRFNQILTSVFGENENFKSLLANKGINRELIFKVCSSLNLVSIEAQSSKVIELYEQLNQRMGVVLLGPSMSGKSTILEILCKCLQSIGVTVKIYKFNPKAVEKNLLLGYIDSETREWNDGLLTEAARKCTLEELKVKNWIIFDGDIDPEWIEALNSVLDDNRLLTMPSGERIRFDSNVNFIFETNSLIHASPATVSRLGIILMNNEEID